MLDLGEARMDRNTDVSSLAVNAYLGLNELSPLHAHGEGAVCGHRGSSTCVLIVEMDWAC